MKGKTLSFLAIFVMFSASFCWAATLAPSIDTGPSSVVAAPSAPLMTMAPQHSGATQQGHTSTLQGSLTNNPQYILATKLMQSTIDLLETRITPEQHKRLSKWQKKWIDGEKAAEIARLSKSMSLERAYITATVERMRVLLRIAAVVPATSSYNSTQGFFNASVSETSITVQGTARNAQGETCSFTGTGTLNKGWMQMKNAAHEDFYVLFTPKAAFITYVGDNASVGCPAQVTFGGPYVKE